MTKTLHIRLPKSTKILQQYDIGHNRSGHSLERCLMDGKGESLTERVLETLIKKSKIE